MNHTEVNVQNICQVLEGCLNHQLMTQSQKILNILEAESSDFVRVLFEIYSNSEINLNLRRLALINLKNMYKRTSSTQKLIEEGVVSILSSPAFHPNSTIRVPFLKDLAVLVRTVVSGKEIPPKIFSVYIQMLSRLQIPSLQSLFTIVSNYFRTSSSTPSVHDIFECVPADIYICHQISRARYRKTFTAHATIVPELIRLETSQHLISNLNSSSADLFGQFVASKTLDQILSKDETVANNNRVLQLTMTVVFLTLRYSLMLSLMLGVVASLSKFYAHPLYQSCMTNSLNVLQSLATEVCPRVLDCHTGTFPCTRQVTSAFLKTILKDVAIRSKVNPMALVPFGIDKVLHICLQVTSVAQAQQAAAAFDGRAMALHSRFADSLVMHAPLIIESCLHSVILTGTITGPDVERYTQAGCDLLQRGHNQMKSYLQTLPSPAFVAEQLALNCLKLSAEDFRILSEEPHQSLTNPETREAAIHAIEAFSSGPFASAVCATVQQQLSEAFQQAAQGNSSDLPLLLKQEALLSFAVAAKRAFVDSGSVDFMPRARVLVNLINTHSNPILAARFAQLTQAWLSAESVCSDEYVTVAIEILCVILKIENDYTRECTLDVLSSLQSKHADNIAWDKHQSTIIDCCLSASASASVGKWAPLQLVAALIHSESALVSGKILENILHSWENLLSLSAESQAVAILMSRCALLDIMRASCKHANPLVLLRKMHDGIKSQSSKSLTDTPFTPISREFAIVSVRIACLSLQPLMSSSDDQSDGDIVDVYRGALGLLSDVLKSSVNPMETLTCALPSPIYMERNTNGQTISPVSTLLDLTKHILTANIRDMDCFWQVEAEHLTFLLELVSCLIRLSTSSTLVDTVASQLLACLSTQILASADNASLLANVLIRGCHRGDASIFIQALGSEDHLLLLVNIAAASVSSSNPSTSSIACRLLSMLLSLENLPQQALTAALSASLPLVVSCLPASRPKWGNSLLETASPLIAVVTTCYPLALLNHVGAEPVSLLTALVSISKSSSYRDATSCAFGVANFCATILETRGHECASSHEQISVSMMELLAGLSPQSSIPLDLLRVARSNCQRATRSQKVEDMAASPCTSFHEFAAGLRQTAVSSVIVSEKINYGNCASPLFYLFYLPRLMMINRICEVTTKCLVLSSETPTESIHINMQSLDVFWRDAIANCQRNGDAFSSLSALLVATTHD